MTYKEIVDKKEELTELQSKYRNEIEEMQWEYVKEQHGIERGNVLRYRDKYHVAKSIGMISEGLIALECSTIKKDNSIGKNNAYVYVREATKEFDSYEEFKTAIENL